MNKFLIYETNTSITQLLNLRVYNINITRNITTID